MLNTSIASFIKKHVELDYLEVVKLDFGLNLFFDNLAKCCIVYLFAFMFNVPFETLIAHLTFLTLRKIAFGSHHKNAFICLITSIIYFPILTYFLSTYTLETNYLFIIALISSLLLLTYAPIGTEVNKIFNECHRTYLRKKLILRLLVINFLGLIIPTYFYQFIILGLMIEAFSVVVQLIKKEEQNENYC